jgi:uncharacterized membrane protein SpoIIM required for sporulation
MLESFINFKEINNRPWMTFIWGFIISTIAILISAQLWFHVNISGVNVNLTGLFAVMFTIIPSVYFVTLMIKREEALEEEYIKKHYHESKFFERHVRDFVIFLYFFAGVTFAFAFWFMILSGGTFVVQVAKINYMRGLGGAVTGIDPSFSTILANNLNVLFFSFMFSFILGAGAVFIIVWNASILGVAIGKDAASILHIPAISSLYVLHGVPEIAGYIAAALAGGLISAAVIRRHGSKVITKVLYDALLILMFAVFSIVCGAFIEASAGMFFWASLTIWWGVFIYMLLRFFLKP